MFYEFGDKAKTRFFGTCDSFPLFGLLGGDYIGAAGKYRLTIDNRTWALDVSAGGHGSILLVDDRNIVDAFASARQRIIFDVEGWKRTLKPNPQIAEFVSKCRAMRKLDPDADGVLGSLKAGDR